MPAKAGTQGLPALNASLDSRLRGSDDRPVGVACIFANLRNEVLALKNGWQAEPALSQLSCLVQAPQEHPRAYSQRLLDDSVAFLSR
jgi:hypothetical protein